MTNHQDFGILNFPLVSYIFCALTLHYVYPFSVRILRDKGMKYCAFNVKSFATSSFKVEL